MLLLFTALLSTPKATKRLLSSPSWRPKLLHDWECFRLVISLFQEKINFLLAQKGENWGCLRFWLLPNCSTKQLHPTLVLKAGNTAGNVSVSYPKLLSYEARFPCHRGRPSQPQFPKFSTHQPVGSSIIRFYFTIRTQALEVNHPGRSAAWFPITPT